MNNPKKLILRCFEVFFTVLINLGIIQFMLFQMYKNIFIKMTNK